jgi:hypothetical protein
MPLKLNVGVSRKVGLPDYGSIGASCNLEMELDTGLLERDVEGFQARIRGAYVAAHQAVHDELARLQAPGEATRGSSPPAAAVNRSANGYHRAGGNAAGVRAQADRPRSRKPATASQVKAVVVIAHRQEADLVGLLRDEFHVERPQDLTLRQASQLIELLKGSAEA